MSYANKFLSTGEINVSDGSTAIYGSKIGAKSLVGTYDTCKIDNSGNLYPAKINSTDVEGIVVNPMAEDLDLGTNNITNGNTISAINLSGTLTTIAQPNIESVGVLTNLNVDGNVGIGTTNPIKKLTIQQTSASFADPLYINNPSTAVNSRSAVIFGQDDSSGNRGEIVFHYVGNNNSSNRVSLGFYDNGQILNVANSGNVGIGTSTPSAKLDVNGSINALNITGTLTTSSQPNITDLGILTDLTMGGDVDIGTNNISNIKSLQTINLTTADGGFGRIENLIPYSEALENWTRQSSSYTPNNIIAPNGRNYAGEITLAANSGSIYYDTTLLNPTTQYRVSFWAKTVANVGAAQKLAVSLNLGSATITNELTTEWQRFTYIITSGNNFGRIQFDYTFANGFSLGESLSIWGVQINSFTDVEYPAYCITNGEAITGVDYGLVARYVRSNDNIETNNTYTNNLYLYTSAVFEGDLNMSTNDILDVGDVLSTNGNINSTNGEVIGKQVLTRRKTSLNLGLGGDNLNLSGNQIIYLNFTRAGSGPYTFTQVQDFGNVFEDFFIGSTGPTPAPVQMKRIIIPEDGVYHVDYNVKITTGSGADDYQAEILKNGITGNHAISGGEFGGNIPIYLSSHDIMELTTNDYLEILITTIDTGYSVDLGSFSVIKISNSV